MSDKERESIWRGQLRIALLNTIRNEIITASGDGKAKPSQYLDGCVESILKQIDLSENLIRKELIILTDALGYDEEKHLDAFNKCVEAILKNSIRIEHEYY